MRIHRNRLSYYSLSNSHILRVFTGNKFIRKDGALVMGRGAAREVRDTHPWVQYAAGKAIGISSTDFGFLLLTNSDLRERVGIFQVKRHFMEDARLDLITNSLVALADWYHSVADAYGIDTVAMNAPGIGNGGLRYEQVMPLLEHVPDWLHVYV